MKICSIWSCDHLLPIDHKWLYQARLPEVVTAVLADPDKFKDLYRFTYRVSFQTINLSNNNNNNCSQFGLDSASGQRILPVEMAVSLWQLVFSQVFGIWYLVFGILQLFFSQESLTLNPCLVQTASLIFWMPLLYQCMSQLWVEFSIPRKCIYFVPGRAAPAEKVATFSGEAPSGKLAWLEVKRSLIVARKGSL